MSEDQGFQVVGDEDIVKDEVKQPEQPKQISLDDLKIGYVVGLTPEGNFIFDVFGQDKELVQLMGVHQHACKRVDQVYNQSQMHGDALTNEVGKAVALLTQKVEALLQSIAPPKPDNKI